MIVVKKMPVAKNGCDWLLHKDYFVMWRTTRYGVASIASKYQNIIFIRFTSFLYEITSMDDLL